MITGEIKNKIDQIWDTFFVAGITNPITVLEQMTYIFFMKMLDDKQLQEEENARDWDCEVENPTFLNGQLWVNPEAVSDEERAGVPYENLRWHVFKNFGADNMFKVVRQSVFEFIKHIGTGEESAYSRYMKSAIFLIPNARTLAKVVDGVDSLDMNNRDAMGDVYEYILGKMAASGTNGQFRTPRHIIRMIVELMEPTPQDYICDPAMGSAGFLVEAVKYIKEKHATAMYVSEEVQHMKTSMINGYDTDQTMLRIGAMNLLLHDITAPELAWRDSLSEQNEDQSCYTLVMANPPFAGSLDKGNVNKRILSYANTSKTELLFLAQFVRSLEIGGRCASIVPDGVLFGTSKAHVAIRKEIVDNQQLRAVISMPRCVQALRRRIDSRTRIHQDQLWRNRPRMVLRHASRWLLARRQACSHQRQRHTRHRRTLPQPRCRGAAHTQGAELLCARRRNPPERLRPLHQQIQGGRARARGVRTGEGHTRTIGAERSGIRQGV